MSFIDNIKEQLQQAKWILKQKWDIGAEQGKKLKEKHKEIINKKEEEK